MRNQALKTKIKELATRQVELKNQKKTVNLQGPRTIEPYKAAWEHESNRILLRQLYMAQGILRGKTQEEMEPKAKTPINMDVVNKLIAQYPNEEAIVCID